jgi:hypothetical protein
VADKLPPLSLPKLVGGDKPFPRIGRKEFLNVHTFIALVIIGGVAEAP